MISIGPPAKAVTRGTLVRCRMPDSRRGSHLSLIPISAWPESSLDWQLHICLPQSILQVLGSPTL